MRGGIYPKGLASSFPEEGETERGGSVYNDPKVLGKILSSREVCSLLFCSDVIALLLVLCTEESVRQTGDIDDGMTELPSGIGKMM